MEMIRELPSGYRTIFNLYVIENKATRKLRLLLNIKESTSASQLHRAKAILASRIKRNTVQLLEKRHYERQMVRRHTRQDGRIRDRRTRQSMGRPTEAAGKEKAVAPPALQRRNLLSGIRRYCAVAAILALIATTIIWMALPDNDVSLPDSHDGSSEIKKENSTRRPYSHDTPPLHPAKIAQVYSKIPGQPATQSLTPTLYNDISISDNNTDTVRPTTAGTNSEEFQKRPTLPAKPCRHRHPMAPYALTDRELHNHYNTANTSDGKNTTTRALSLASTLPERSIPQSIKAS